MTVRNTGDRDGDEVVMLFAAPPNAGMGGAPVQSLLAFDRVSLKPGAETTVGFTLSTLDFSVAGLDGVRDAVDGTWRMWVGNDPAPSAAAALSL